MAALVTVELVPISASASQAHVRDHTLQIDRPHAKGGADQGPMGGELFLVAVGGCLMSNLLAAIRTRDAAITVQRIAVCGTLIDAPTRYQAVEVRVSAVAQDKALLAKILDIADRGCILTNTLRNIITVSVCTDAERNS